jgi:hypothetical protein
LKKQIALLGPNSGNTTKPGEKSFAESLRNLGRLSAPGAAADAVVFVDFDTDPKPILSSYDLRTPAALIRQEPMVVRPQNYRKDFLSSMKAVIDVGRSPQSSVLRVNWPQDWKLDLLERAVSSPSVRKDRFVMINRNLMSFVSGEMYSLRRLLAQRSKQIDVWGMGWDMPFIRRAIRVFEELIIPINHGYKVKSSALRGWFRKPIAYLGPSDDKLTTLVGYDYSIVIENSLDYMSEKLFDCLFTGTLPVYVGPDPESFGIPSFVAIHSKPNIEAVMESMELAKKVDLQRWRKDLLDWLNSQGVEQKWSGPFVLGEIIEIMDSELFDGGERPVNS